MGPCPTRRLFTFGAVRAENVQGARQRGFSSHNRSARARFSPKDIRKNLQISVTSYLFLRLVAVQVTEESMLRNGKDPTETN